MARWGRLSAVGGLLALVLTGCAADPTMVARRDLADASPLAELLGTPPRGELALPHLDPTERERQDRYAALVAECMADAGFAYEVVPMSRRLGSEFLEAYALAPAEFASRYGYGVTTITLPEFTDPNQEIRAGLDPPRRQEYDRAMWGGPDGDGCHAQATRGVYGDAEHREADFRQYADLLAGIDAVYRQIDDDPRLREAHQRWAECLAGAGYPELREPADARRSVFARLPAGASATAQTPDLDDRVDPTELRQVREYELALAVADLECRRRHLDGVRRLVTLEREGAFVDAHREELSRYRDSLRD